MYIYFKMSFWYNIFVFIFLWCNAEFTVSLLWSSVSHDPSEIIIISWFAAQETFFIIKVEKSCFSLLETNYHFFQVFFDE